MTGLGPVTALEVLVLGGPGEAWAMTWRDRPQDFGPLFLEQTYRMAAEAWEDGERSGLAADPVWRPDWARRVGAA